MPKRSSHRVRLPAHHTVTPPQVFFNRRQILAGLLTAGAGSLCSSCLKWAGRDPAQPALVRPDVFPAERNREYRLPEGLNGGLTPRETAATHNNFYELLPGRAGPVWEHAADFQVEPWRIEVAGECVKPAQLDLDDLFAFAHEERLYHFRCVERWAMNVPWSGFPLRLLLDRVEPNSHARYVRFVSAHRPEQMPGVVAAPHYPWPYHEALRLDEAMHELTFVATGVYGEPLPKQHGAPVRLVVPWKYGYKSPKSIVRIELTRDQPKTFWQILPHEYGFLSNVNPNIPHPRWSQELSFWLYNDILGPTADRAFPTPLFNGYGDYVAELYPDEPRTLQRVLQPGEIAR